MRFFVGVLACVGIAVTVAGCDPLADRKYIDEGVGVDLNSSKLPRATDRQDEYIYYICEQAGYRADETSGISSCFDKGGWTAFVQAGMNDIDQRCDAYLSWLDAKRRDREPVLRELAAAGAATHSIMAVYGATTKALDAVSSAFGLAAATYSNWNSRLLLEVNQSTVQTIVYSRQTDFRNAIKNEKVSDRSRAIYLLRNYVRICLPITIETDINTSITLVQRGNAEAVKKTPVVETANLQLDVRKPVGSPKKPVHILHPAVGTVEETLPFLDGVHIQTALCTKGDGDFGLSDSDTRKRLKEFKAGYYFTPTSEQKNGNLETDDDRRAALTAAAFFPNCKEAKFNTPFEVGIFARQSVKTMQTKLAASLKKVTGADESKAADLAKKIEQTNAVGKKNVVSEDVRKGISILSRRFKGNDNDTIDYKFMQELLKDNEPPSPG